MQCVVNQVEVVQDVVDFVDCIDQLVIVFDYIIEQCIEWVVWIYCIFVIGMVLLLIFIIIWLCVCLLWLWKQLLSMVCVVSQCDFIQWVYISGCNEMVILGMVLNNMLEELVESYVVFEWWVQEKIVGLEQKNEIFVFLWQVNCWLYFSVLFCECILLVLNGLQGLMLLCDIEVWVYDLEDEDNYQEFICYLDDDCDDKGCYFCLCNLLLLLDGGIMLKWWLLDVYSQYGILLVMLLVGCYFSYDQQQLVDILVEQLISILVLDCYQEKQQQLIVMEEWVIIVCELYDFIVQLLFCMKMQVSCLQM